MVLWLRAKSIKTLQAQLSLFLAVWVLAELLRSFSTLGFLPSNPISQLIGLTLHTISMVVFGVAVTARFLKYFRGGLTVSAKTFSGELGRAIQVAVTEVLGGSGARAFQFYVEPSLASSNIAGYTDSIRKLFGPGAEVLEKKIAGKLYSNLGLKFVEEEGRTLADYVGDARQKKVS